jgi:hypothetical protein
VGVGDSSEVWPATGGGSFGVGLGASADGDVGSWGLFGAWLGVGLSSSGKAVGSGVASAGGSAGVADAVGEGPAIVGTTTAVAGWRAFGGSYRPRRSKEQAPHAGLRLLSS